MGELRLLRPADRPGLVSALREAPAPPALVTAQPVASRGANRGCLAPPFRRVPRGELLVPGTAVQTRPEGRTAGAWHRRSGVSREANCWCLAPPFRHVSKGELPVPGTAVRACPERRTAGAWHRRSGMSRKANRWCLAPPFRRVPKRRTAGAWHRRSGMSRGTGRLVNSARRTRAADPAGSGRGNAQTQSRRA